MNRKVIVFAVLILLITATIGTLGFFTDRDQRTISGTAGSFDIALTEMFIDSDGNMLESSTELIIIPGSTVNKMASVKNLGNTPIWVRLKPEPIITDMDGNELSLNIESGTTAVTAVIPDQEKWVSGADGFWYYVLPLSPGETTDTMYYTLTFSSALRENAYWGAQVNGSLLAQAVQAANNGSSSMAADGWS